MLAATLLPPAPRQPNPKRALTLLCILAMIWGAQALTLRAAHGADDDTRIAGYTFALAVCTSTRSWCSDPILDDPTLRPLEECKALAPVFDGPQAHRRVLGPGVDPKALVLAWSCTPHRSLPEA